MNIKRSNEIVWLQWIEGSSQYYIRLKIKYEMMYHDSMTYIIHYRNITAHILVLMYYNVMCITKRMKRGAQHNPVIITNKGLAVSFGRGLFDYNSDYCWREDSM